MVLCEILAGKKPWGNSSPKVIAAKVLVNERPDLPPTDNERVRIFCSLIRECWRQDPLTRPSAKELIEMLQK
jgi:hypothetical protein